MPIFIVGYVAALVALAGAFYRVLSRSKEFRKPRVGLQPNEVKGEEFQDIAALTAFLPRS